MKFTVTLKDPDGFYESFKDAAEASVSSLEGVSDKEREQLAEMRLEQIKEQTSRWVEYGEYIEIEFDTEAKTATVVPK